MDARIYLITKADDLGSNNSANRAFYDGYKKGILRNGVIMTTCSSALEAAELFREEKGFCMGLHLTMNAEWDNVKWGPVLPPEKVPSIVDSDGNFFATTKELRDNNPKMDEILSEMQAQLDLARDMGLDIKFADCHMGFASVLEGLDAEITKWKKKNGLVMEPRDFDRLPMAGEGNAVEKLITSLDAAAPGIYYIHMGHPAYDTEEMRNLGHPGYPGNVVAEEREWDRRAMMDDEVLKFFKENSIKPISLEEAYKLKG